MSKTENIKQFVEKFVSGYIAGSSNSYDECKQYLISELEEHFDIRDEQHVEMLLDAEIAEQEIFLCEVCGWWCWSHEFSEVEENTCNDCVGE